MRFVFYHIVCFILLIVSFSGSAFGQIFSENADTVIVTSKVPTDTSIFVFHTNTTGTLIARCPVPGLATFEWTKYNTANNDFSIATGYTDSVVSNLNSDGYQVRIKVAASSFDTVYTAWVYVDSLSVTLEKDNLGDIKYNRYTCEYTDLRATPKQSNYIYYNAKGIKQTLPPPTYLWSSAGIKFYLSDNTNWLRIDTSRLPLEKAIFSVQIKDNFGRISKKDSVKYTPIICKAIMETTDMKPIVDGKNSAPFTVSFLNKSKNAVTYKWFIANIDSFSKNTMDSVTRTFRGTGKFKVRLLAQSQERCTDTTSVTIDVAPGQIGKLSKDSLPNIFVPGSTTNPCFKIYNISIKHFRFTVFSRWGKQVYQKEDMDMLQWEGWNGRINGSGTEASDGIYYYVLEVFSWDKAPDPTLMNTKYSGFFYLFRQN